MTASLILMVTLTVGLLAAPLAAQAQQADRVFRIGVLGHSSASASAGRIEAFRQGLRDLGYVEGKNVALEYRWSEGKQDRMPELAKELVRRKVDVIVTHSVGGLAAKHATTTIPIVLAVAGDPVGAGLVASLARPGGNVTGLSLGTEGGLSGKRLQLLTEVAPKLSRVGVLWNRANPGVDSQVADIRSAASILGVRLQLVEFRGSDELEGALASLAATRSDALIVPTDAAVFQQRARVIAFTARNRLPAIYAQRETVEDGGLMAYASSQIDMWRRAATYVDRILKGAKPADLPVEQPTKFELVINLKTARALGLTIPPALLARADEVIQ
jgi:putative tryptophan/tyrosine transport system substrate-binding protein